MRTTLKTALLTLSGVIFATACGSNNEEKATEALLDKAKSECQTKQFNKALATIDSLRKAYPENVEARKKALKLYQDVALAQAQSDLAHTDSLLQAAKAEYAQCKAAVEQSKAELRATPEELQNATLMKMRLDSLQVRFDVQCAKIKYIHKKQKE